VTPGADIVLGRCNDLGDTASLLEKKQSSSSSSTSSSGNVSRPELGDGEEMEVRGSERDIIIWRVVGRGRPRTHVRRCRRDGVIRPGQGLGKTRHGRRRSGKVLMGEG
jgi:hypothetical protein